LLNKGYASDFFFSLDGNRTARFTTDASISLSDAQILMMGAHLPGLKSIDKVEKTDIQITHVESSESSLIQNGTQVILKDQWSNKLSPDFVHLFYGVARISWLEQGILPIHAAAVGNDKEYILLVGHPGAGKTSITLQAASNLGLKVFSGDKTLIKLENDTDSSMTGIGGTAVMTLRQEDLVRWPNLEQKVTKVGDRSIFKLDSNQYTTSGAVKIKAIVLVQLNDGAAKFQKLSTISSLHTLYPYFVDTERADVILAGGNALLDGNPKEVAEVKTRIVPALRNSLMKVPAFQAVGSLSFVVGKISEMSKLSLGELNEVVTK
jgi:hypothetical protein